LKVELLEKMGSDLSVVNSARVSFDKESKELNDKDERLIKYLATHNHWTPFTHSFLSFRITAPIFVARQLAKHQVGLSWNEVSRRYVKDEPQFYIPEKFRKQSENIKQGSLEDEILVDEKIINSYIYYSKKLYNELLSMNICNEQARIFLPINLYTKWIWSGSLYAFSRVCNLRLDSHSQKETRIIAELIGKYSCKYFPISWKYLKK